MCGILGSINLTSIQSWDRIVFRSALNLMQHRGPDDEGLYVDEHSIFGHRRLSILDLDPRAKQPMLTEDGRYLIVFNGEIYNFRELKATLRRCGVEFTTEGDTEVLLKGYVLKGSAFIDECIGMFAFCIYDKVQKTAHLYRDRLGIKPLYYSQHEGVLSFSSTVQSLVEIHRGDLSRDEQAVVNYLSYRYPLGDRTFFNELKVLQPGQMIEFSPMGMKMNQYWSLDTSRVSSDECLSEDVYAEQLLELLKSTVDYRLIADVPVGAFLSGGVDSSGLVGMMSQAGMSNIRSYSIGYAEKDYNELHYAKQVAKQFGTQHTALFQDSGDYLDRMQQLIRLRGAPLGVPNEVAIWKLSEALKQDITVVLSGEGADELFWGYGRLFRSPFDFERMQAGYSWSDVNNRRQFARKAKEKYGQYSFESYLDHFLNQYTYTSSRMMGEILHPDLSLEAAQQTSRSLFENSFNEAGAVSYGQKISYTMIKHHLPGLLQRLDNATMAASVEGRVPFVDHRLVQMAYDIPDQYKLKWKGSADVKSTENLLADEISEQHDIPKAILKKTFSGMLDDTILHRKKMGFPIPLSKWMGREFKSLVEDTLLSQTARDRGIINQKSISQRLNRADLSNQAAMQVWMLVNLELFYQQYPSRPSS